MRNIIRLINTSGLLLTCIFSFAQKHDYNFFNKSNVLNPGVGTHIQFVDSLDGIVVDTFVISGDISFSPVFSDRSGDFLCYTNNSNIYDSLGRIAINGDSIAVGYFQNLWLTEFPEHWGSGVGQNAAFIPVTDSLFYLFHCSSEYSTSNPAWAIDIEEDGIPQLYYSDGCYFTELRLRRDGRIEIDLNKKKVEFLRDTLLAEQMTFVKHANGEDWWILFPEHYSDSAYLYRFNVPEVDLISKGKIYLSDLNDKVVTFRVTESSPDGQVLARFHNIPKLSQKLPLALELFYFDRCTGQVDRFLVDTFPTGEESSFIGDVQFSDNGRFLYMAIGDHIIQLDMEDEFPTETWDTIATIDDYRYYFLLTTFEQLWKLPNGEILVGSLNSTPYLHYIREPNNKGDACNFERRAIRLPMDHTSPGNDVKITTLPIYPPYRMPPLDYDCETSVDESERQSDVFVSLYPNPAWAETTVQIHGAEIKRA
ncbi:MAG TPA: hypothetical protein VJ917_01200, partial [Saprospiraceae bacterium]|nr:hypothetical protein [Saprospiraceae bacterium]